MVAMRSLSVAGLLTLPTALFAQAELAPLSADSVRALVAVRLSDSKVPALAVGMISNGQVLRITRGRRITGGGDSITPSTVFEIGSISKVFTGLILADMITRREVALDDPVSKYLPAGTRVPERNGKVITLRHLTTHTSGLPRLPDNLAPKDPDDPYADYDSARLIAFLNSHQLRRDPGASYEYSNLGAGLLGWALSLRAAVPYPELLRTRILDRLGMKETGVVESEAMRAHLATGHDAMGEPTPAWHLDVLAGAGAIRSTLADMLRFADAAMDTVRGPLAPLMAMSQREWFRVDSNTSIGLGWHRRTRGGRTVAWHNGGTGGFRSMLAVDAGRGRAGVALTNAALSQDALGLALVDPSVTVQAPPAGRPTVVVEPAVLARYAGRYRLAPDFVITITARGTRGIDLQATGQPRNRLYASSPTEFFLAGVAASVAFETDSTGTVTALVLHQNGRDQRAAREP